MLRASVIFCLILALAHGNCAAQSDGPVAPNNQFSSNQSSKIPKSQPSSRLSTASKSSAGEDPAAENELLELANRSRELTRAPPLHVDETLPQGARHHPQL